MEERGILRRDSSEFVLGPEGGAFFHRLGVDLEAARARRRSFARACMDWSERRYHLAGALGAALLARTLELGWIERRPATRAVRITAAGRRALMDLLGLDPAA